jgi:hypothetical protein
LSIQFFFLILHPRVLPSFFYHHLWFFTCLKYIYISFSLFPLLFFATGGFLFPLNIFLDF